MLSNVIFLYSIGYVHISVTNHNANPISGNLQQFTDMLELLTLIIFNELLIHEYSCEKTL